MTIKPASLFYLLAFIAFEIVAISFIDRPVSEYLRAIDVSDHALINFFRTYTDLGKAEWWVGLTGLGIIISAVLYRLPIAETQKNKISVYGNKFLLMFIIVSATGITADILKPLFGRARPVELERQGIYGFHPFTFGHAYNSLPSGHSVTAVTMMLMCIQHFPKTRHIAIPIAIAVAVSRIMVNAHYVSDVVAGGALAAYMVYFLSKLLTQERMHKINCWFFPIDRKKPTL